MLFHPRLFVIISVLVLLGCSKKGTSNFVSAQTIGDPSSVATDGTRLFVADYLAGRVLIWNSIPTRNQQPADVVVGQPDMTTQPIIGGCVPNAQTLCKANSVYSDGTRLFVADRETNRVLVWNSIPQTNGKAADVVLSITSPISVTACAGRMFVAAARTPTISLWNTIPTTAQQAFDIALGGTVGSVTFTSSVSSSLIPYAYSVACDGTRVFVADEQAHRIVFWSTIPSVDAQTVDFVLGQSSTNGSSAQPMGAQSVSAPFGVFSDGNRLFVADYGHDRVLMWSAIPTTSNQPATLVLGEPDFFTADAHCVDCTTPLVVNAQKLRSPTAVASDAQHVYVADGGHSRVLIWNSIPTVNGQAADVVLGQPDMGNGQ